MPKKGLKTDIDQPDDDETPPGEAELERLAELDDGEGDIGTASQKGTKPPQAPAAETPATPEAEDKVPHQVVGKLRAEKRELSAALDAKDTELEELRRDLDRYRAASNTGDPEALAADLEAKFADKPGELLADILRAAKGERSIDEIRAEAEVSWSRAVATNGQAEMEGYRGYLLEFQAKHPELQAEWAMVEANSRDLARDMVRMAKRYMDIDPEFVRFRETEAEKRGALRALKGDLKGLILDEDPNPASVAGASGATPTTRGFIDLPYEKRMEGRDAMKSLEALAEA